MKKAVVTGGAGFIGSHLAEELSNRDLQVMILDDLSTGHMNNIEAILKKDNVEFIEGSITNLSLLNKSFQGANFVFHQAAITSVPRSIKEPEHYYQINATGTLNVLKASRDNGVKKVVYASSSSVYGDTITLPKTEDMTPNPKSPYAESKVAGEHYCNEFLQTFGLSTICLRYFNVYGPRQNPDGPYAAVVPRFMNSLLTGEPMIIYGDGTQSRDFTYVSDVIKANILAAESNCSGVFNIGSNKQTTINKLARTIMDLSYKSNSIIKHRPKRPGDVMHSLASIKKARCFGFKPEYSLIEGLREMYGELTGGK